MTREAPMPKFENVDAEKLEQVLRKAGPKREFVLVDVYAASGCATCTSEVARRKIEETYASTWHLLRLDVDATASTPALDKYRVIGIPTLILFKPGERLRKYVEVPARDGHDVMAWLAQQTGAAAPLMP